MCCVCLCGGFVVGVVRRVCSRLFVQCGLNGALVAHSPPYHYYHLSLPTHLLLRLRLCLRLHSRPVTAIRLNKLYREAQNEEQIVELLRPLIKQYAREREDGEKFGDFVTRVGIVVHGVGFHD